MRRAERESDLLLCVRLYSCMTLYAERLPLRVRSACEAFVLCVACDCGAVVSGLPAAVMSQATRWVARVRF